MIEFLLPYADPQNARIEQLTVRGQDASPMEFRFPVQKGLLSVFTPPAGVEVQVQ